MEAQWKKSCLVRRHPTADCSALGRHPGRSDQGEPCQVGSGQLPVSLVNGPAAEEHSIASGVRRAIGDSRMHQLSGHGHGHGHDPAEVAGWLKMGNPTGFAQSQLVLGFVILRGGLVSFGLLMTVHIMPVPPRASRVTGRCCIVRPVRMRHVRHCLAQGTVFQDIRCRAAEPHGDPRVIGRLSVSRVPAAKVSHRTRCGCRL